MGITTIPREARDRNDLSNGIGDLAKRKAVPICERPGSLIDIQSPYFASFVVLSAALKEAMGGSYPPAEEVSITNGIWRMVVENEMPFSTAKAFADEKSVLGRKRYYTNRLILNTFWEQAKWNTKNRMRREP
jgi:hypothetical protein